jgi:predicted amidohydrolase
MRTTQGIRQPADWQQFPVYVCGLLVLVAFVVPVPAAVAGTGPSANAVAADAASEEEADGWKPIAPRDEIRPDFQYMAEGGPDGRGALVIEADQREGLQGTWVKTIPVEGGRTYRFQTMRRTEGIAVPRRTAVVRLIWQDSKGNKVARDEKSFPTYRPGDYPTAEPEYVHDVKELSSGWVEVAGVYAAPKAATQLFVELNYRWEPSGRVEWSMPELKEVPAVVPRIARLATIHLIPVAGKTRAEKCEQFAPLIAEAASKKADLVVLPETLTQVGMGLNYVDAAETIPGPSTSYFGLLAKQHDLYIVAGLVERDGHLVYNTSVLIGPDGNMVGKYRKVTLPRGEVEAGVAPGYEYPVFETRFGRVGMMICYDGFFPEVARELSNAGAEVIAWPVAGCNPMLAQARACENHVWLVSSTYTDVSASWMVSAIFDPAGSIVAQATKFGTVVVHEVDLAKPMYWQSLGDFRAQVPHHRPAEHHEVQLIRK